VLGHLDPGALTLASLAVLVPHLEEHGKGLIEQALGKSKREVQRLVAEFLVPAPNSDRATLEPGGLLIGDSPQPNQSRVKMT